MTNPYDKAVAVLQNTIEQIRKLPLTKSEIQTIEVELINIKIGTILTLEHAWRKKYAFEQYKAERATN